MFAARVISTEEAKTRSSGPSAIAGPTGGRRKGNSMNVRKSGRIGLLLAAILALLAVSAPGMAQAKDSNRDRIPDRWEKSHSLTLKKDQRKLDQDKDGLRNRGEFLSNTDPRDKDSDDDGITDVKEKAGVIASYDADAGTLTVTLYAGGELTGTVTDNTRVKCESDEAAADPTDPTTARSENSGPGSRHSEDESGDDDSGDDESSDDDAEHEGHHGGCNGDCSIADLAEGVEITEAGVRYTADGAVFDELEIVKPVAAP